MSTPSCSGRAELGRTAMTEGSAVPAEPSAELTLGRYTPIPSGTDRLFPHHRAEEALASPNFLIGRLLEDGDGADLRWLFASHGTAAARDWFALRGERQLSSRSRAFWTLILNQQTGLAVATAEELWPL